MRLNYWLLFTLLTLPLLGAEKLEPSLADRERMARESRQALGYLNDYHYVQKQLKDLPSDQLIKDFVGEIDYHRMFMTQAEIKTFAERFQTTLQSVYLSRGDLYPAVEIYNYYYKAAKKRLVWIKKRLAGKFDFTTKEKFLTDRSKAEWPADAKAADALWNARLTHELLQEMLNDQPLDEAKAKIAKRYERSEKLLEEFDLRDLQTTFLTSIAQMYDPHSNYFSNDALEDFSISMSNTLVGIGAMLRDEDGYCVIQELIPGGPAESSGKLHQGDKIVEVAQGEDAPVDVVDLKLNKIVKLIRGEPGSLVNLTIIPADAADPSIRKKVTIERAEIRLTENLASAQVVEVPDEERGTIAVGVIELPSFYGGGEAGSSTTSQDIKELIEKLQGMGIKGLVLDLRRNGGGLLNEAVNLVGLFIPKAPVVQVKDSVGRVRVDWDRSSDAVYEGPLVVLTSRQSASASEIVAGALQSLNRAIIVGDKATHGKGTVQAIFEVDRGLLAQFVNKAPAGGMKVTIQKFYLPDGASTQHKGVSSDIALPAVNDVLPIGESDLPNALPWDTISAANYKEKENWQHLYRLDGLTRDYLLSRSAERQAELPEFAYLNEIVNRLKLRQEEKAVSLNYDMRLKEKQLDLAFKQTTEKRHHELAKKRYAAADVLLDISWKMKAEHQSKLKDTPLPDGSPRANAVYESVFYYAPEGALEIKEVKAETIDWDGLRNHTKAFATTLGTTPAVVEQLLNHFKQGEDRASYNIVANFEKNFPGVDKAGARALAQKFFLKAIELNPELALDHPALDIPLREALRVSADWASVTQSNLLSAANEEPAKELVMVKAVTK